MSGNSGFSPPSTTQMAYNSSGGQLKLRKISLGRSFFHDSRDFLTCETLLVEGPLVSSDEVFQT